MKAMPALGDLLRLERGRTSHKGDNGIALVIGGSAEYIGAAYLSGIAALRAGCDKVIVAAPERVAWALNIMSPDLITCKLPGKTFKESHYPAISKLINESDAFLIGSGMGRSPAVARLCRKVILDNPRRLKVIDADALAAIRFGDAKDAILTPHRKELDGLKKRSGAGEGDNYGRFIGSNVVVEKGPVDIIRSQMKTKVNRSGNAMMTVAGTGDVLAGLALGFLASSKDPWKSACTAAYINGEIGDALWKEQGTMLASDFLARIPSIIKDRLSIRFL